MSIDDLKHLYPFGTLHSTSSDETDVLSLPINEQWFHIPLAQLHNREIILLQSLFPLTKQLSNIHEHPWYHYLYCDKPFPNLEGEYRVIHIKLKNESPLSKDWLTHFSHLFNQVEDSFFIDTTHALIIEKKSLISHNASDIEGMLLTLESDFLIKSQVCIGMFYPATTQFPLFFKEECHLFTTDLLSYDRVISFQDISLTYLTQSTIQASQIMQYLKTSLKLDDELQTIIKTLWLKQGNISSTSKELYIHRNTLQYKLDKFSERTGLSLKSMTDLTLCYLLIH